MSEYVPSIDLTKWFSGAEADRRGLARPLDDVPRTAGFPLLTGHGVPREPRERVRAGARAFFTLPEHLKPGYPVPVGGRGWLPPGAEANGYAEGTATPADLKESFSLAADDATGDPEADARRFVPNVWPTEVPGPRPAVTEYLPRMRALRDELMSLFAVALGPPADRLTHYLTHPRFGFNITWYLSPRWIRPARARSVPHRAAHRFRHGHRVGPRAGPGRPAGLYRGRRVGGRVVRSRGVHGEPGRPDGLMDRGPVALHPGVGATPGGTGGRADVFLLYFSEADHDAVIETPRPPIGPTRYPPVVRGDYPREKLAAISVG